MAGEPKRKPFLLTRRDRKRVARAVDEAESTTGLQICVYLGPGEAETRAQAEQLFVNADLSELPSVLLLVAPNRRKLEIVTAAAVRDRLTDEDCQRVVADMTEYFARDQFVEGLLVGIGEIARIAGPGTEAPGSQELPDVID